ncbi:hypothetical protein ACYATO_07695 [Lactobacillaceae bacterium Melli_B3]
MILIFNFTDQEANALVSACQSFKQTMSPDNQRGRGELDRLIERLQTKQNLNPLGTNFTILKQALRYYREQNHNQLATVDQLLARFKGIC